MSLNATRIRRSCIKLFIPATTVLLAGNAASGAAVEANLATKS